MGPLRPKIGSNIECIPLPARIFPGPTRTRYLFTPDIYPTAPPTRPVIPVITYTALILPGKTLAKMKEAAARAIIWKCSELRARLSAFARFHRCVWAPHLGLHPAGMRGVHLDFAVAQLVRQMHGEGIERSLRRVVSKRFE